MSERTCEERIEDALASRLEDFRDIMQRAEHDDFDIREQAYEEQNELPLSIEVMRSVRVVLGTGGPHDEFVIDLDSDNDIRRIRYKFQDWFDGAERTLEGTEHKEAEDFLGTFVDWAVYGE